MSTEHIGVMVYPFLTTSSAGAFNSSGTGQAIMGEIKKIVITSNNWANGSIFITDVTTGENLLSMVAASGTARIVKYPLIFGDFAGTGATLSGTANPFAIGPFINGPVLISGLGLGNTTSGTVQIYYRM